MLIGVFALLSALMLSASASSSTLIYKASCTGSAVSPPVATKATGLVSISIVNASFATGYFYSTNIKQMTQAHLHAGAVGKNGPSIAWAFNATYGARSRHLSPSTPLRTASLLFLLLDVSTSTSTQSPTLQESSGGS